MDINLLLNAFEKAKFYYIECRVGENGYRFFQASTGYNGRGNMLEVIIKAEPTGTFVRHHERGLEANDFIAKTDEEVFQFISQTKNDYYTIKPMTENQKKENEAYFDRVINYLKEGGTYGWIMTNEILVKKGDKLQCSKEAYEQLKQIVTPEFFEKRFELKPIGHGQ